MEYERIEKVQNGIISPSKLRMKLMGPHHGRKKDGSNSNSARTSPSRLQVEDAEFAKNSLLSSNSDFDEEELQNLGSTELENQVSCRQKEAPATGNGEAGRAKAHEFTKGSDRMPVATAQSIRAQEDENLDYDSNASSSSFEFHRGERPTHNAVSRPFLRPIPSKWNDAEKWIVNRQVHSNQNGCMKRNALYSQMNRAAMTNMVRVAPDLAGYDHKLMISRMAETKRFDYNQPAAVGVEKFPLFRPACQAHGANTLVDQSTQSSDQSELACAKISSEDTTVVPAIRSVCMRDMGTEMTPMTSQEPSRTTTPAGATTPLRSPTSSAPSTPRRVPAPTPAPAGEESQQSTKKELSEQEMKEKTRREIVALGVQLGKMNIAAWASKEEPEKQQHTISHVASDDTKERELIEFDRRAKAWEEAERSKHAARYRHEEIKIQAWESRQKAKLETELQRLEAKVEQMRAQAKAKMAKKIALTRQISDEKRAAVEARKNRDAERTAAQAELIRQTGQMPSTNRACCGWWSL